jgi:magnesium-transporting ATPase (P-type)
MHCFQNLRVDQNENDEKSFALIIDGGTLGILFNENLQAEFRAICLKCDAVLCCRMSPAQKAEARSKCDIIVIKVSFMKK